MKSIKFNLVPKLTLLFVLSFASFVSLLAQTYTFTTATASGITGPNQTMVDAAYAATSLDGQVTVIGSGIQEWVVPSSGFYTINGSGASGGHVPSAAGGAGRQITVEVFLTAGDVIRILVGQEGGRAAWNYSGYFGYVGGGGGGTFIYNQTTGNPILICGGGGGAGEGDPNFPYIAPGVDASVYTNTSGQDGTSTPGSWDIPGIGGTAGGGGTTGQGGSGGCGFSGNGVMGGYGGFVGTNFLAGGLGGANRDACSSGFTLDIPGGFGGGAGAGVCYAFEAVGGGGGGYSGGGGSNTRVGAGGGGGNFISGTFISTGTNIGHGQVIIIKNCISTSITLDNAVLPDFTDQCSATPAAPTATTSCSIVVNGTPDVTFPITAQGTTLVTWSFDDGFGNTTSQTQNIVITDVTPPIADLATLADVTDECSVSSLTAPTATDNCAGVVTVTNDAILPITTQGTTVVTWSYEDEVGNISTQVQNVVIDDVTPPVADLVTLPDLTACVSINPTPPTATDNCGGTISGTPDVTMPITTGGLTIITWTFDDGGGNTITQTQNVTVSTVEIGITTTGPQMSADAVSATYQWLDCNNAFAEISGATNQSYAPGVSGSYAVEVTEGGCTDTSACTVLDFSGIGELENTLITVYPNPSSNGKFIVVSSDAIKNITLVDQSGRIITVMFDFTSGEVDASGLASGSYVLQIVTETAVLSKTVLIL